jgi:hypothetical protein
MPLYEVIQQAKNFKPFFALTLVDKNVAQRAKIQECFINPQDVYILHYSKFRRGIIIQTASKFLSILYMKYQNLNLKTFRP